jgi:hypothetical protein
VFDPTLTDHWIQALDGGDEAELKRLAETEYPGTTLFHLAFFAMRLWKIMREATPAAAEQLRLLHVPRIHAVRTQLRSFHDWPERRRFDVEALREFRRGNAVLPVVGAGASMAAGCPGWAALVEQLLQTALDSDRQRRVPVPKKGGGWYVVESRRVFTFGLEDERRARAALDQIRKKAANTELLMIGAQMCADLFKEDFFSYITPLLYLNVPDPGPVHLALARLAAAPGQSSPGWPGIVTYNFDNLLGEALERLGRPHSIVTVRNGDGIMTEHSGQRSTEIIHVHGFVARELMRIDGIQYVFSTAQYEQLYGGKPSALLNTVKTLLQKPDVIALFVGCSFIDAAMNDILQRAANLRDGILHFALIQLPRQWREGEVPEQELADSEQRYLQIGVQPIWFRRFEEIPEIIDSLA